MVSKEKEECLVNLDMKDYPEKVENEVDLAHLDMTVLKALKEKEVSWAHRGLMVETGNQEPVENKAAPDSKVYLEKQDLKVNLEELFEENLLRDQSVILVVKDNQVLWEKRVNQDILVHMELRVSQASVVNLVLMDFQAHQDSLVTRDLKVSLDVRDKQEYMEDLVEEEIQVDLVMLDHQVILSLFIVRLHLSLLVLTAWLNCGMATVYCTWKEAKGHMAKI